MMNDLLALLICFIGGFLFLFLVMHFLKKEEEEIKRKTMPIWERPQKIKKTKKICKTREKENII